MHELHACRHCCLLSCCSFFRLKYRVAVASGQEALCKDFCMCLHQGAFLLLASQSPQVR